MNFGRGDAGTPTRRRGAPPAPPDQRTGARRDFSYHVRSYIALVDRCLEDAA